MMQQFEESPVSTGASRTIARETSGDADLETSVRVDAERSQRTIGIQVFV